jgi:hypothetical protein
MPLTAFLVVRWCGQTWADFHSHPSEETDVGNFGFIVIANSMV